VLRCKSSLLAGAHPIHGVQVGVQVGVQAPCNVRNHPQLCTRRFRKEQTGVVVSQAVDKMVDAAVGLAVHGQVVTHATAHRAAALCPLKDCLALLFASLLCDAGRVSAAAHYLQNACTAQCIASRQDIGYQACARACDNQKQLESIKPSACLPVLLTASPPHSAPPCDAGTRRRRLAPPAHDPPAPSRCTNTAGTSRAAPWPPACLAPAAPGSAGAHAA
jgi:hypothetical protein